MQPWMTSPTGTTLFLSFTLGWAWVLGERGVAPELQDLLTADSFGIWSKRTLQKVKGKLREKMQGEAQCVPWKAEFLFRSGVR